jgi:hypothetical protein
MGILPANDGKLEAFGRGLALLIFEVVAVFERLIFAPSATARGAT